jgi:hypothetical protein
MTESPFSSAALRRAVERELTGVEPGHGHAELEVTLPDGTVRVLLAARVDEHWQVQGAAQFRIPTREWGAVVRVVRSW